MKCWNEARLKLKGKDNWRLGGRQEVGPMVAEAEEKIALRRVRIGFIRRLAMTC